MTPEERLTQTEKLLETAARYIDRHSHAIEQNSELIRQNAVEISQLKTNMNDVLQLFSELAAFQRQSQEQFNRNQEEIRRIWEYLMSQKSNGNSPN
jgi:ABC-type transporter Mla subunit MlaD